MATGGGGGSVVAVVGTAVVGAVVEIAAPVVGGLFGWTPGTVSVSDDVAVVGAVVGVVVGAAVVGAAVVGDALPGDVVGEFGEACDVGGRCRGVLSLPGAVVLVEPSGVA